MLYLCQDHFSDRKLISLCCALNLVLRLCSGTSLCVSAALCLSMWRLPLVMINKDGGVMYMGCTIYQVIYVASPQVYFCWEVCMRHNK